MNQPNEGREEKTPYFKLSKNEHGGMWLFYRPSEEGRYNCWEPIDEKFWNEFEELLSLRDQLSKEQEKHQSLKQEVAKFIFWHDKFFNDTIVGQPPSLTPLRSMLGDEIVKVQSYEEQLEKEREMRKELVDGLTTIGNQNMSLLNRSSIRLIQSLIKRANDLKT